MTTKLIHLHIAKSGGTSQRSVLYDLYGESGVYWYGINSDPLVNQFSASETADFRVIGGHKRLRFYPTQLAALYTAVVREPISRAVSLYSYYARPELAEPQMRALRERHVDTWRERGMDSTSLLNSLRDCDQFRRELVNHQCGFLSRGEATFEAALATLSTLPSLVCTTESIAAMNEELSRLLGWGEVPGRRINRSQASSHDTILAEPGAREAIVELVTEDLKLYQYLRDTHHGLLVNRIDRAALGQSLAPATPYRDGALLAHDWNQLSVYGKGYLGMRADGTGSSTIAIVNRGPAEANEQRFPGFSLEFEFADHAGAPLGSLAPAQALTVPIAANGLLEWPLQLQIPAALVARTRQASISLRFDSGGVVLKPNLLQGATLTVVPVEDDPVDGS